MIAEHEEQRRGPAELAEVEPLREVLPGGVLSALVLFGHERVAEINVKIRRVGERVGQRALIQASADAVVEVRVGGDGEGERAAWRTLGVEIAFRAVRAVQAELIEILRVGPQRAEDDFSRLALLELARGRLFRVIAPLRPVGDGAFGVLITQHADRDGIPRGPAEHHVARMRRHVEGGGVLFGFVGSGVAGALSVLGRRNGQAAAEPQPDDQAHDAKIHRLFFFPLRPRSRVVSAGLLGS